MKDLLKKVIVVISIFLVDSFLFASKFDLPDVDNKYIGTYIPVDIEEEIKKTKDFYKAINKYGYPNHHDVLFLGKNVCYSDAHFHDGYAVQSTDFLNYKFETTSEGTFVYDEKGYKYRQISNFLNKYGYGYEEYTDYVTKLIFENQDSLKNIKFKSNLIELAGVDYQINLDSGFFDTENVILWLWSDSTSHCALVRNGLNVELHEGYRGEYRIWYPKEEVKTVYPLMFLNDKDFPSYYDDLPKDQYRLLRNLVYARHGYIFKSADLNAIFNQFSWYKPNPVFSESMLTDKEKEYIEKIKKKESELK